MSSNNTRFKAIKCPCGDPICSAWMIQGTGSEGRLEDERQATAVADLLNQLTNPHQRGETVFTIRASTIPDAELIRKNRSKADWNNKG